MLKSMNFFVMLFDLNTVCASNKQTNKKIRKKNKPYQSIPRYHINR